MKIKIRSHRYYYDNVVSIENSTYDEKEEIARLTDGYIKDGHGWGGCEIMISGKPEIDYYLDKIRESGYEIEVDRGYYN